MKKKTFYQLAVMALMLLVGFSKKAEAFIQPDCYNSFAAAHPTFFIVSNNTALYPSAIAPYASAINAVTGTTSGATLLIDTTVYIDQSITFTNCQLYFAPHINMGMYAANVALGIVNSTLSAACDTMWDGINGSMYANNSININNSTLMDMQYGVNIGAIGTNFIMNATNNQFINNFVSIRIQETPTTYAGVIYNNTFYTNSTGLIQPYFGQQGETGIWTHMVKKLVIGSATNPNIKNTFHHLKNGIELFTKAPGLVYTDNVEVYNPVMYEIRGSSGGNQYNNKFGSGIYGATLANTINLYVGKIGNLGNASFQDCDKGIILDKVNATVQEVSFANMMWGFSDDKGGNAIDLTGNYMENVYRCITLDGTPTAAKINNNNLSTRNVIDYIPYTGTSFDYPWGIKMDFQSGGSSVGADMMNNYIRMNAVRGVGIHTGFGSSALKIERNIIELLPSSSMGTSGLPMSYLCAGIYAYLPNDLTTINGNIVYGNANTHYKTNTISTTLTDDPTLVTPIGEPSAIMVYGNDPYILCNRTFNIRYGMQIRGNAILSPITKVAGNELNNHAVGIMFKGTATPNTSGFGSNFGNASNDNNNVFNGSTSYETIVGGTSSDRVKIYFWHTSTTTPTRNLRTNSTTITNGESWSNQSNARKYVVSANSAGATTYNCSSTYGSIFDPSYYTPAVLVTKYATPVSEFNNADNDYYAVYPNPASDVINLSYSIHAEATSASFILTNTLGQVVKTTELPVATHDYTINSGALTSGIYYCSFMIDGKIAKTMKIIISH